MLLDTSGLLCLHFSTEPLYTQACIEYKKAIVRLTHNYIIAEYVALANARKLSRSSVLDFVVDLLNNPDRRRSFFKRFRAIVTQEIGLPNKRS